MVRKEPEYIELNEYHEDHDQNLTRRSSDRKWTNLTNSQIQLVLLRLGVLEDETFDQSFVPEDIHIGKEPQFMLTKIDELSIEDSISIVRDALVEHNGDVNYLADDYKLLERLIRLIPREDEQFEISDIEVDKEEEEEEVHTRGHINHKLYLRIIDWNLQIRLEAALIHYHSPYPEIRAITEPYDDPTIPIETFRVYVISLVWTCIGSVINNFFVHRMPGIGLSSHTMQVLFLPCGKLWERYMPHKTFRIFGYSIELNPGPWTYKEMMLATIIYSCSSGTPYSVYNIFVMKLERFYNLKWVTYTFQVLLSISTQFLGFGFALLMKKVCVYPSKAIWPTILPTIALNRALMKAEENNPVYGWKISQYTFFYVVCIGSFFYNWIPSYFFTALSQLNWPTWFSPNSIHLVNVTGTFVGLGLNPWPTFDWNIFDAAGCLTIPFYTYANHYIGSMLAFFIILIVYYTNNYWTAYLPINSNRLFNNKGEVFNVHDLLDENNMFDNEKYQKVGPPYFTAANLVLYGAFFCLYPFAIVYHFTTEWESMKSSFHNVWVTLRDSVKSGKSHDQFGRYSNDPHCKMMAQYEDVPDWWFLSILIVSTSFAIFCVSLYPTETPIWGIFCTMLINFIFLVPITSIASVTGFSFGLNVLVELIIGYTIPNSGIALITLKSYGYNIDTQASNYITDQKLAHYAKIPPRAIFRGQLISTLLNVIIALFVSNWQIDNIPDICDRMQKDKLSCPGANTYFYSSIQYGEIGPAKVFGGLYPVLKWCFLLGVILVIPCVWFKNHGPQLLRRYFQPTIIIGGFLDYAPYNLSYFTGGLYVSYLFMYHIKNNYILWWEKYNYILTSALSAGVAFSALLIFFTTEYITDELNWWGNNITKSGIEGGNGQRSWLNAKNAPNGYFGLREGSFP